MLRKLSAYFIFFKGMSIVEAPETSSPLQEKRWPKEMEAQVTAETAVYLTLKTLKKV